MVPNMLGHTLDQLITICSKTRRFIKIQRLISFLHSLKSWNGVKLSPWFKIQPISNSDIKHFWWVRNFFDQFHINLKFRYSLEISAKSQISCQFQIQILEMNIGIYFFTHEIGPKEFLSIYLLLKGLGLKINIFWLSSPILIF